MAARRRCRFNIEAACELRNRYAIDGTLIAVVAGVVAWKPAVTLRRVSVIVMAMSLAVALCHAWIEQSYIHAQRATVFPSSNATTSVVDIGVPTLPARANDWAEPRVDLNGNEIDAAVGDYRVDRQGEMYERHAPDTALLHLSAPEL